ncbi:MAG: hypothetical protein ACYSTL_00920 [Planctomycetota bacterium]|jgi:hypothetical protein
MIGSVYIKRGADRCIAPVSLDIAAVEGARNTGTILLEVLLALTLLFTSAAVVFSGLSTSYAAVNRVRFEVQASDLGVSKLSELQMRQLAVVDDGPNFYESEDLSEWTWQIVTASVDETALMEIPTKQVEIVITHTPSGLVHRLVALVVVDESGGALADEPSEDLE